ncbi:sugar phosphate isomerase/epimerase family protein [Rhizobium sp.]
MVRTAIHAGVWSTDPDPEAAARVLAEVASVGFDALAIPLRKLGTMQPAGIARAFEQSGVTALGTTGLPVGADVSSEDPDQRRRGEAHLRHVLSVARDIGVVQVGGVIYGRLGHAGVPDDIEARKRSAEVIARVLDFAETTGVRLCAELVNRYETSMLNTVEQALDYISMVGHPGLKLHLDTYHMAIEERDPAAAARAALPVLGYFELDQSHRGRLDEGSLDLSAMAAPIRDGGYDGFIGVEAFSRSRLAADHANTLSIWRDHFDDGTALARNAMSLIREIFHDGADIERAQTRVRRQQ